jgi:hypothetical protein
VWISSIDFGESDLIGRDNIGTFVNECSYLFGIASDHIYALPVCLFNESQDARVDSSDFPFDSLKKPAPQIRVAISLRSTDQTT